MLASVMLDAVSLTVLASSVVLGIRGGRSAGVGDKPPVAYTVLKEEIEEGTDEIDALEMDADRCKPSPPPFSVKRRKSPTADVRVLLAGGERVAVRELGCRGSLSRRSTERPLQDGARDRDRGGGGDSICGGGIGGGSSSSSSTLPCRKVEIEDACDFLEAFES
jgi:hypothetical protein